MDTALGGGPLTQLSSLVGRTDELVELARLLNGVRLLTLTGPAGVGKSRLALELVGREVRGKRHVASVVRLGSHTEPDEIRRQVLTALGEPSGATPPSAAAASDATSEGPDGPESTGRDQLLLLEPCEHGSNGWSAG
ncbi:AAA family ATPase [Streptomyces asiaticus]